MSDSNFRPPCPKCKREVANYFDHTQFDCKSMTDIQAEEEVMLRAEYRNYLDRCNDTGSTQARVYRFPMSYDDWWRAMADEAKDSAKYAN